MLIKSKKYYHYFWKIKKKLAVGNNKKLFPEFPKSVVIDPSNICNLGCPLCPTGAKSLKLKRGIISVKDFTKYLDKLPFIEKLLLYNWGEPLLNPNLLKLIKIAKNRGIKQVEFDSNFSIIKTPQFFSDLVDSGIDLIRLSIDGASQETYEKYKRKGNFALAIKNATLLREIQKKKGKKNPKIIWKFLVNKHNENELEIAKKIAKKIDVELQFDFFQLSEDMIDWKDKPDPKTEKDKWLTSKKTYLSPYYNKKTLKTTYPLIKTKCMWLFENVVINPNGDVLPCCYVTSKDNAWGNLNNQSFESIWYGDKYQYARSLYNNGEATKVPIICTTCPIFKFVAKTVEKK